MKRLVAITALFLCACVTPDHPGSSVVRDLAPTGKLRAAINYGNGVLAQKGPNGEAQGVSVDLARELARRLNVPLELVSYDAAGKVTAAARTGAWDIAFVARDPQRAQDIDFTVPYVIIEGGYMVPASSSLQSAEDVDRDGVRIAVGRGSAYDLYLTRALKHAALLRGAVPGPAAGLELFERERPEAYAGVKPAVVDYATTHPDVRVLAGHFMLIEQCMAIPRGRDTGMAYLRGFVNEMKASGFVAAALERSGQKDAAVAP